jgi:hypothetical protein
LPTAPSRAMTLHSSRTLTSTARTLPIPTRDKDWRRSSSRARLGISRPKNGWSSGRSERFGLT